MYHAQELAAAKKMLKGLTTAASLTKNKHGKLVSKKKSALGKKNAWIAAVTKARKALGLKGFSQSRRPLLFTRRPRSSTNEDA